MKISIATTSKNHAKFIPECVSSVNNLCYYVSPQDFEYIVVDAVSEDETVDILSSGDSKCRVIVEADSGPAEGLNKAFTYLNGQYGFFINSDDFILPRNFAKIFQIIQKNPDIDIILCGGWLVDDKSKPLREVRADDANVRDLLTSRQIMFQPGMVFKMELFRKVGGFNEANKSCWDLELLVDMLACDPKVVVSNLRVGCFRVHSESLSAGRLGTKHTVRYNADLSRIACKHKIRRSLSAVFLNRLCRFVKRQAKSMFFEVEKKQQFKAKWVNDHR